jgi:serine/threonine-protein kinase RsbW
MAELVLDNGRTCAETARRFVRACLERQQVPESDAYDILVAVNEAVANAHTHLDELGGEGRIEIRCSQGQGSFEVEITDHGRGFDHRAVSDRTPELMSSSGRGLFLMSELMDEVEIDPTPQGTTVRMARRFEPRRLVSH